uniref:Uncharacterized protein n=1 Tax=Apteryx owenii TaxID=8824 RepID=A0A8B9Q9D7_APTOW
MPVQATCYDTENKLEQRTFRFLLILKRNIGCLPSLKKPPLSCSDSREDEEMQSKHSTRWITNVRAESNQRVRSAVDSAHALTADVSVAETARAAELFLADGVILTGTATAMPADPKELKEVKHAVKIPVLIGSGVTLENVRNYLDANAVIIASSYSFVPLQTSIRDVKNCQVPSYTHRCNYDGSLSTKTESSNSKLQVQAVQKYLRILKTLSKSFFLAFIHPLHILI